MKIKFQELEKITKFELDFKIKNAIGFNSNRIFLQPKL